MSTTTSQALAAIRTQIGTAGITFPIYWHGEDVPALPDTPTTFAFVVFNNEGSGRGPAAYGGGRGLNLYRNRATVEAYVFAPNGEGLSVATDAAELIAASLRSFRDNDISCFSADAIPVGPGSSISVAGLTSVVSQYQCAVAEVTLHFDLIG
jgi:hypothetical protein